MRQVWLCMFAASACSSKTPEQSIDLPTPPPRVSANAAISDGGAAADTRAEESTTRDVIQLDLVEGTPTTLPDGTVVNVKGVMYAHLPGSRNLSRADLVVMRGGQTAQIGLAREHGGSASNEDATETALGWEFTIEMADPYHRPSRATVQARRTQP